jgi:glycosyltransferase involved in cell wall biosynthesis
MTLLLVGVALSGAAAAAYVLLLALRFRRAIRRPAAWEASGERPHVLVIVPVRGALPGLGENLRALLGQDYPDYEVAVVTEDAADPACPAVRAALQGAARPARLYYAGRPDRRSGKLQNLLAGIEARGREAEVYVFLDADARPEPPFLSRLVGTLLREAQNGVATGYRWVSPPDTSIAALLAVAWNAAPLHFLPAPHLAQAWGGATAITREAFESLGVAKAWDRAISDDASLNALLRERRRPIAFAPGALVIDRQSRPLGRFWSWGLRQVTILKACAPRDFALSLAAHLALIALYAAGIALAWRSGQPAFLAALLPLAAELAQGFLFVAAGRELAARFGDPRFRLPLRAALFFPLAYLWLAAQELAALPGRTIAWAGRRYRLDGPYRGALLDDAPTAAGTARGAQV